MLLFAREWPVLLVDDEPDVLAVSQLAMRRIEVDSVPIVLHTARSKAEAMQLLQGPLGGTVAPYVAVAFIDVVMETDEAGLELCQYIRQTLKNKLMQLYIRTGQPGVAPERSVIDRYDINGYFTKIELTEDKLYSLVKAAVRQFRFASMALAEFSAVAMGIRQAGRSNSRAAFTEAIYSYLQQLPLDGTGHPTHNYQRRLTMLDEHGVLLKGGGYTEAEAIAERDRLLALGLQPLGAPGDGYVIDGHDMLIKVAATETNGETYHLSNAPTVASPVDVLLLQVFTRSMATLTHHMPAPAAAERT